MTHIIAWAIFALYVTGACATYRGSRARISTYYNGPNRENQIIVMTGLLAASWPVVFVYDLIREWSER